MIASETAADSPIERLRALIMADEALQHRLIAFYDPIAFADAAAEAARAAGIDIAASTIGAAGRGDPLGIDRFRQAPATDTAWPGRQWVPTGLTPSPTGPAVDWTNMAGMRLDLPFFEDTAMRARALPLNRMIRVRTPLALLEAGAPPDGHRVPDGLIFHMSRCGSTLVAQMLAADPRNIVPSEPRPVEALISLLQQDDSLPLEDRVRLLRAIVGALGRDRFDDARHFVIKLDSWHARALPLFRAAFPTVPWLYLYRDPVEVMMSHHAMPGMHVVPGVLIGIDDADSVAPHEFAARALSRICDAVADHWALGGGLLVEYPELPGAMATRILPHFGIVPDPAGQAAMAAAGQRDAKAPTQDFVADSRAKQRDATPTQRAVAALIDPAYARLQALRAMQ